MKKLMLKSLLLGFLALSVVACQEDLIPSADPDTDVVNDLANQSDSDDCFELVFPLEMELPDGTTETVDDYEALEALYEAYDDEDEEPNFVFPLLVIDENGEELSVTEEELYELYEACEGMDDEDDDEDDDDHDCDDEDWLFLLEEEICFDFIYPVTLTMPDGDELTFEDGETMAEEIYSWYEENPDEDGLPELQYPVELIFDEIDLAYTATDDEELFEALEYCEEDDDEGDCFEVVFPIEVVLPDGTIEEVHDEEALFELFEEYDDEDEEIEIVFPISIMDEDGEIFEVNEEELEEWLEDCDFWYHDDDDDDDDNCDDDDWFDLDDLCFELVLPITLEMPDGSELEIGPDMNIFTIIEEWYENHDEDWDEDPVLIYPIEILYDDGSVEGISDEEALEEAIEDC